MDALYQQLVHLCLYVCVKSWSHLSTCKPHRPDLSHMTTPSCKEHWEILDGQGSFYPLSTKGRIFTLEQLASLLHHGKYLELLVQVHKPFPQFEKNFQNFLKTSVFHTSLDGKIWPEVSISIYPTCGHSYICCRNIMFEHEELPETPLGCLYVSGFLGGLVVKKLPASTGDLRIAGSVPGLGKSPGRGPEVVQNSCLENPMDRGAWRATVHRVAKSQTWLKRLSMHIHT